MTGSNLMDIFTQKNITEIYQFENYVNSEKTLTELWDGQKSNLENESSAKWTIMVNTQYCGSVEIIWIDFPRIRDLVLQVNLNI